MTAGSSSTPALASTLRRRSTTVISMSAADPASESPPAHPRPAFTRPRLLLLVALGGAIGTAGREGVALALPAHGGLPWAVLIVNLAGALVLGFLLTALSSTAETPRRRDLRVFVGTGMMGGFTTYSALATDSIILAETQPAVAAGYAVMSVAVGLLSAALGMALARALIRREGAARS